MDIFGELEVEPEAIVQGSGSKQRQQLLSGVCPQGAVISRVNCQSQIPQPHGLFLRKTPTCLQTHTHTPPLNDFLQVLLDSVSMGAVHPPPHTHTQQYLPRLPSQLFAGNTHPFSGDVARGSSCTHKSRAPFWEMKGSKDTYIHLHTNWESKNRGRGAEHRSPSISASPF